MASEQARNLRRQGIAAAKAGQQDQARTLLQQSLRLEPGNEAAWIWLASVARNQQERLFCFQKLLEVNPNNETALQALQSMGISPGQLQAGIAQAAPATRQPAAPQQPQSTRSQTPGIPVPDPQHLASIQQQVDDILRQYRREYDRIEGVEWVQKSRRRAGERDSMVLRLYVWSGAIGILAAILIIGGLVVWNTPSLRGIVFAPTWTPTLTPSLTPTPTFGFTPTPSVTPELTLTPSPTIDPSIPQGNIDAPPVPTVIYPELSNRRVADTVNLINRGEYSIAIPTLVREREATELSFDPAPYYYEAIALLGADDPDSALTRLEEAEGRLSEAPNRNFKPLIDTGFAQVHLYLAQQALTERDNSIARDELGAAEIRADSALSGDPLMVPAYVTLARRYILDEEYDRALRTLNVGLSQDELKADVNLLVERGEVYFQQEEFDLAAQEAYTALYIDPTVENAYLLQIKTALAEDDPGLAVIYAQNYLFFYPGSTAGFKLLGDARVAEGNIDLALQAYNQALTAEERTDATVPTLLARAAILMNQRRFDQARQDYTEAYSIQSDLETRALRMEAAFQGGNLGTALNDAEALLGTGVVPDNEIQLLRARILIDEANANDTEDLSEALDLLNNVGNSIPNDLQPIANEFRARAQFLLGDYDNALRSVEAALLDTETGSRRFLRGQIFEALEQPEDAIGDYEWVVTWSEIYPYPFLPDARRRLRDLEPSDS